MKIKTCIVAHQQNTPGGGHKTYHAGIEYDTEGMAEATVRAYFRATAKDSGDTAGGTNTKPTRKGVKKGE